MKKKEQQMQDNANSVILCVVLLTFIPSDPSIFIYP